MSATERMLDTLKWEAQALDRLHRKSAEYELYNALQMIVEARMVIITGVGKSGLVGQRMAATFTSVGKPTVFIHPVEGLHGDMGLMTDEDVIVAISHSGNTREVLDFWSQAPHAAMIAITGDDMSSLARGADEHLNTFVTHEADLDNIVPTSSCVATAAIGDALAMGLKFEMQFGPEDFKRTHPGGSLGERLANDSR